MKNIIRLKESDLVRLIKKVIKEDSNLEPKHFMDIKERLRPLGFKFENTTDTYSLNFGDNNNNFISVTYYKNDPRYYVISMGGGKYDSEVEPPRRINPKKLFEKTYSVTQTTDLIKDVEMEYKKLRNMMGLTNKA